MQSDYVLTNTGLLVGRELVARIARANVAASRVVTDLIAFISFLQALVNVYEGDWYEGECNNYSRMIIWYGER